MCVRLWRKWLCTSAALKQEETLLPHTSLARALEKEEFKISQLSSHAYHCKPQQLKSDACWAIDWISMPVNPDICQNFWVIYTVSVCEIQVPSFLGCRCAQLLSCVWLSATLWTMACQAPLSMGFFSSKNTGVGYYFLLQGIFPTQGLNPHLLCLLHCRQILYPLSHQGSPGMQEKLVKCSSRNFQPKVDSNEVSNILPTKFS